MYTKNVYLLEPACRIEEIATSVIPKPVVRRMWNVSALPFDDERPER